MEKPRLGWVTSAVQADQAVAMERGRAQGLRPAEAEDMPETFEDDIALEVACYQGVTMDDLSFRPFDRHLVRPRRDGRL